MTFWNLSTFALLLLLLLFPISFLGKSWYNDDGQSQPSVLPSILLLNWQRVFATAATAVVIRGIDAILKRHSLRFIRTRPRNDYDDEPVHFTRKINLRVNKVTWRSHHPRLSWFLDDQRVLVDEMKASSNGSIITTRRHVMGITSLLLSIYRPSLMVMTLLYTSLD